MNEEIKKRLSHLKVIEDLLVPTMNTYARMPLKNLEEFVGDLKNTDEEVARAVELNAHLLAIREIMKDKP